MNLNRVRNFVKRVLDFPSSANNHARVVKETQYIWGGSTDLLNLAITAHCPLIIKISEMKIISNPRLLIESNTFWKKPVKSHFQQVLDDKWTNESSGLINPWPHRRYKPNRKRGRLRIGKPNSPIRFFP